MYLKIVFKTALNHYKINNKINQFEKCDVQTLLLYQRECYILFMNAA